MLKNCWGWETTRSHATSPTYICDTKVAYTIIADWRSGDLVCRPQGPLKFNKKKIHVWHSEAIWSPAIVSSKIYLFWLWYSWGRRVRDYCIPLTYEQHQEQIPWSFGTHLIIRWVVPTPVVGNEVTPRWGSHGPWMMCQSEQCWSISSGAWARCPWNTGRHQLIWGGLGGWIIAPSRIHYFIQLTSKFMLEYVSIFLACRCFYGYNLFS